MHFNDKFKIVFQILQKKIKSDQNKIITFQMKSEHFSFEKERKWGRKGKVSV